MKNNNRERWDRFHNAITYFLRRANDSQWDTLIEPIENLRHRFFMPEELNFNALAKLYGEVSAGDAKASHIFIQE